MKNKYDHYPYFFTGAMLKITISYSLYSSSKQQLNK